MREYWLDPPELPDPIICPVCRCECSELYFDINDDIVGCDSCISCRDAAEYKAEKDEMMRDLADEMRADAAWESRFDK